MEKENNNSSRRNFLKLGALGGLALAGTAIAKAVTDETPKATGKKVKVLTADGKLIEVDSSLVDHHASNDKFTKEEIRQGIEGKKFIRVIDLAKCANERKCIEGCQKAHNYLAPVEYIKVKKNAGFASSLALLVSYHVLPLRQSALYKSLPSRCHI